VFRTLFLQETIRRGVLMPSLVVSYSHSDADIDRTIEAIDGALGVYARALEGGAEGYLVGPASRAVFDRW
jgi:glutamate-1-semialdehyde 2,1-aminomutase